jgi:hypothetical protein
MRYSMSLRWARRRLVVKLLIASAACALFILGPLHYYVTVLHAGEYGHWNYEEPLGWYVHAVAVSAAVLVVVTVWHLFERSRSR